MVSYLFEEGDKFLFFNVTKINFRVAGRVASFSNMTDKKGNQWALLYTVGGRVSHRSVNGDCTMLVMFGMSEM